MKPRSGKLGILAALLLAAVLSFLLLRKGKFKNEAAFKSYYSDYVVIGRLGNHWPAKVTNEIDSRNEITFNSRESGRHTYPGFEGYTLKVVFLESEKGRETVMVLRSIELD